MIENALLGRVIDQVIERADRSEDELLSDLRGLFPGVHFSVCNDDDMPARLSPAAGNEFCRLYYVESGGHCLQLTGDADAASGLVVALIDRDES
ncbi:MAG: hypothetical protein H6R17_4350 [Proteobacteria bacterium]|nr:hypothetical protein [Pseudomonadota bacterium]